MTSPPCLPHLFDQGVSPPREQTPVQTEIARLNAAAERVLARLQRGPATNVELSTPEIGGLAAIRRVWDLQQRGHVITKAHVKGGVWKYTLEQP
jgi:hypothetical protein